MRRTAKPRKSKGRRHNTQRTCSGKVRYRDRMEADRALHRLSVTSDRKKVPSRKYECPECSGWHLTSRPDRFGNI